MLREFMSLIPWTLQEEVMKSPRLETQERLLKALAFDVMPDLGVKAPRRGRDNIRGTCIGGCRPRFAEGEAQRLFRSLILMSSLEFSPAVDIDLFPLDELRYILSGWSREDHHANDPAYRANFVSKPSNARIPAALIHRRS
jgi:hypothetical protein